MLSKTPVERLYLVGLPMKVLRAMKDERTRTSREIVSVMGMDRGVVNTAVKSLRDSRYLDLIGQPKANDNGYKISEDGKRQLSAFREEVGKLGVSLA